MTTYSYDMDAATGSTPKMYAAHLATYIRDAQKIRSLVKYRFGSAPSIESIRHCMPTPQDIAEEAEISDARKAYLRSLLAELPDPQLFADALPEEAVEALRGAWRSNDPQNAGCWRVADHHAPMLRSCGLVEAGGYFLGAFGNAVRKAVVEW